MSLMLQLPVIWLIHEELFVAKSQAHIVQVQYQLATLKKGSNSVVDYFQNPKLLHDTLASASKTLPLYEFITFLL